MLKSKKNWLHWQKKYENASNARLAQQDLVEALEIAELGSMKLYLVDYHLESGRLRRAQGRDQESKEHFQQAARLIEETVYHRRDKESEEI